MLLEEVIRESYFKRSSYRRCSTSPASSTLLRLYVFNVPALGNCNKWKLDSASYAAGLLVNIARADIKK